MQGGLKGKVVLQRKQKKEHQAMTGERAMKSKGGGCNTVKIHTTSAYPCKSFISTA
jgi:hypothetical protein